MIDFNLEKQSLPPTPPLPPDVVLKLVIIGLLLLGAAITAGLWWRWEIRYARIQERESIEASPQQSEPSVQQEESSENIPPITPNGTLREQQPLPQNPETNINVYPSESNILGLTEEELYRLQNFSPELEICLRNGGGKGCLDYDYKPNLPQSKSSRFSEIPNVRSVAIAVASGRELQGWKPNYNLHPMPPGICPPSLLIAYQNQQFCGRRPILKQSSSQRHAF
jgi:hypothetical protein